MSRHTGPRLKIMRALGVELPGLSRKSIENRPHPPGQHGQRQRRPSDFALKLREKQKLRFNYGLTERQIQRVFLEAKGSKLPTGAKLLELLERRLDNLVFRSGFAPTLPAARQLVRHRHVLLNGKIASIPSMRVRPGDTVTLQDRSFGMPLVIECLAEPPLARPEWLTYDETARHARVTRVPLADEVPFPIDVQQVVEYYANRI